MRFLRGRGVAAARHLWAAHGVRVLPGAYLARPGTDGAVLGSDFIRVAVVEEQDAMVAALQRLKDGIDNFVSAAKGAA